MARQSISDSGPQNNFAATAAPTVSNDSSGGYEVGSRWVDVTNDEIYICVDASVGAAVWEQSSVGTAGEVVFTPAGNIAASDVQNALEEIDTDKITASSTDTLTNKTLTDAKLETSTNAQTGTTYTLVLADASKHITMTNASANTLTVPPNSSVAFPVGTRLMVQQKGAGSTTIAAGSGVTVNAPASVALEIGEQFGSRGLLKTATDTWELI